MKKDDFKSSLAADIIAETESEIRELQTKTNHYINNEKLLEEMIAYKDLLAKYEKGKIPDKPKVSEYIGSAILRIAEKLASRPNFSGYSYKDEMIGDGIENCMMYLDNFNPEISKNPFAYLTQIIYFAFIRRIQKEKRQAYTKMKIFEQSDTVGVIKDYIVKKYDISGDNAYAEYFKLSESDIAFFESKNKKKRAKRTKKTKIKKNDKKSGLDDFLE